MFFAFERNYTSGHQLPRPGRVQCKHTTREVWNALSASVTTILVCSSTTLATASDSGLVGKFLLMESMTERTGEEVLAGVATTAVLGSAYSS